jgi:hypothetical protein
MHKKLNKGDELDDVSSYGLKFLKVEQNNLSHYFEYIHHINLQDNLIKVEVKTHWLSWSTNSHPPLVVIPN